MKIQDLLSQQAIQGNTEVKKQDGATKPNDAFAFLLQDELSELQAGSSPGKIAGSDPTSSLPGVSSIPGLVNTADNSALSQPISAIEAALSNLDSLGQALQGNQSPKDINSIIDKLNAQAAGLDGKLSGLPADHPLKDLGEEVKITAYTESVKWNRGDYL